MKRLVLTAVMLAMAFALCSCGTKAVFRDAGFGMSVEQVKKAEAALTPVSENSKGGASSLVYEIPYNSEKLEVTYLFSEGKLEAVYVGCQDLETLKGYLTEMYGEPQFAVDHVTGWFTKEYEVKLTAVRLYEEDNIYATITELK